LNQGRKKMKDIAKGVIAGAIGGLGGCLAMNEFQRLWSELADGSAPHSAAGRHDAREWQERTEGQNSNELAAQTAATTVLKRPLTRDELAVGATAVHFVFGAAVGAVYGYLVERSNDGGVLNGATFGSAVWAAADEVAMPVLGLSRPTTERPAEPRLQSFTSHIVFGVATETVRRAVRHALG
jgi:hypothetical protein